MFIRKWFKRFVEYHLTNIMAGYDLFFNTLEREDELASLFIRWHKLRNKLHEDSAEILNIFKEMQKIF